MTTPTTVKEVLRTSTSLSPRPLLRHLKDGVAAYRRLRIRTLLFTLTLVAGVVGAAAFSLGNNPAVVVGGMLAAALVADLVLRFPGTAATVLVVCVASAITGPFALVYGAAATRGNLDPVGAVSTLFALIVLAALLAHRTSRGRPWVTTLLVVIATMFAGPWLLVLNPHLGFAWAWLITAGILILRSNLPRTAWTRFRQLLTTRRTPRGTDLLPEPDTLHKTKPAAIKATAALLQRLPDTYTVLDATEQHAAHIVVGPTGVHAITSAKFTGTITDHPDDGLTHPRVPVADLIANAAIAAATITQALPRRTQARGLVVIHEAKLPAPTAQVALSTGQRLTLTGPDRLRTAITQAPEALTNRQISRILARLRQPTINPTSETTEGR